MSLRPDLEALPLDDGVVVFSEKTQRLVGLNASAKFVFRKLQQGRPASEIAEALVSQGLAPAWDAPQWVTATLDALASQGMLVNGQAPKTDSAGLRDEEAYLALRTAGMPPYAPFEPVAERYYRLLDTTAKIRFAHERQVRSVNSVLGHLETDNPSTPAVTLDIRGVTRDDGHVRSDVYRDGEPQGYAKRLSSLAPVVKGVVWQAAANNFDFLLYIHAGVVGTGETCVLLPASAGSGKSSLTAALTHKGFRYFSDEVAMVSSGTFLVPPMPLAFCVKNTGWDIFARYYPDIQKVPTHRRNDRKIVRYLAPPIGSIQRTSALVSHIVFPKYAKDSPNELEPIGRVEALRRLMEECLALRLKLDTQTVTDLTRWIAGIDCYALRFSSLDKAADLVARVVGGGKN